MIYKLANPKDVDKIYGIDEPTRNTLIKYTKILSEEYGEERDVDNDYGGYVLYVPLGTNTDDLKDVFDYTEYGAECVEFIENSKPVMCVIVYVTSCDYGVVIVISPNDMPDEMKGYFDDTAEEICPYCDHVNKFLPIEAKVKESGKKVVVCKGCGKEILACTLCEDYGIGCGTCNNTQEVSV